MKRNFMSITEKRLEEIKAFKDTDFSDCPELTDEQLVQMKPSHLRNIANHRPIRKTVNNLPFEMKQPVTKGAN